MTHIKTTVMYGVNIYAVYHDGNPIRVRKEHSLLDISPKYSRVTFIDEALAQNAAEKLNAYFKTDKFHVKELG